MSNRILVIAASMFACTAVSLDANAIFTQPAWERPQNITDANEDNTTFQHWDIFTSVTHNAPDIANLNPHGTADAFDSNPSSFSFITGNIYSFAGVIKPRANVPSDPVAAGTLKVLAQAVSWGNHIDTADVKVNGTLVSTLPGYSYSQVDSIADPQGQIVYHAWTFETPNIANIQIDWGWGVTSSSFTELLIDTKLTTANPGLIGDATLDGKVNTLDFNVLAGNFGLNSGALWSQGDFSLDGAVNSVDFGLLVANFGRSAANPGPLSSVVPEPVFGALILFALPLLRRRYGR